MRSRAKRQCNAGAVGKWESEADRQLGSVGTSQSRRESSGNERAWEVRHGYGTVRQWGSKIVEQ